MKQSVEYISQDFLFRKNIGAGQNIQGKLFSGYSKGRFWTERKKGRAIIQHVPLFFGKVNELEVFQIIDDQENQKIDSQLNIFFSYYLGCVVHVINTNSNCRKERTIIFVNPKHGSEVAKFRVKIGA